ncbi:FAD-binding oxidoreductase [Streptomyces sp. LX-29]|uniref:NAD(P)/FAD-dependent oxidoreductase n=1 Tax=Streptomyces sp. LX-29 TaxID=2900152 RepID=UPI00240E1839|nr:FAD-binding oxidoreductase [Streptomyces sp. LX-29]WFB06733.1 FAD-binding oxidoreductase [Streptomyces sp. LX-29]
MTATPATPGPAATAEVVVVGGGVVGAAIAHALVTAGAGRVVLCEQGRAAWQGATSRSGGLLRLHHTSHPDTRLATLSLPVFQNWSEAIGGDCGYRRTGFVMLVDEKYADRLAVNSDAVVRAGGASRVIDLAEVRSLYPGLNLDGVGAAAYEPEGGYADPAATTAALLAAGRRHGLRVYEGTRVEAVETRGERVTGVATSIGRIAAGTVVLAQGAWGARLARPLGVDLPVRPRRIGIALADTGGPDGVAPAIPTCIDDTTGRYFRPDGAGRMFFGVPSDDGMELDRELPPLTPEELTAARAAVGRRVPAAATAPVIGTRAGFDGYTPDRRPVIGPAGPEGCYLATGFSGGGFKTAPVVGSLVAAELIGTGPAGPTEEELLRPYRPDRFAAGRPSAGDHSYAHM